MSTAPAQHWDPERYRKNAGFVAALGLPVVELLAPKPGERILDLGCGDGALTKKLADMGVDVVGTDDSAEQIEAARQLGLDARVVDGHDLAFNAEFDAVFTNAALHWMKRNPDAVIDGVWRALKPGGRFVGEMGGHGNVASIVSACMAALARRGIDGSRYHPWFFPTPDAYRGRLERRGFRVRSIGLIPRPTPLPSDIEAWLDTFCESFMAPVPLAERPAMKREIAAELGPKLKGADGIWIADYVRLRFAADKPN
ncbi:MAG: trans-aconitate 2-methyltransferase [Alphaproteobacteria bacterium]